MKLLEVHSWNSLVGVLVWDEERQSSRFEFAPSFIKKGIHLSPLVHPTSKQIITSDLKSDEFSFELKSSKGLPLFLSDSLPDKFGTDLFSKYLEIEGRIYSDLSPLEKLAYIGSRGMGALEFKPAKHIKDSKKLLDLQKLNELSISLVTGKPISHIEDMTNLFHVGTSPGGAQPKVLINIDSENGDIFRGDEFPNLNQESWILKFNRDIGEKLDKERGKIEYAYYLLARQSKISIMESRLMTIGEESCFMTKRFDRKNGEKIHTQTLHAMSGMNFRLPNTYSYEQIFRLMNKLKFDYTAKEQLFRIMVFNVIGQNVDDHTKNFGFNMTKDGIWHFSPAYDLTFTYNENYNQITPHFLSINGKNKDINSSDLESVAKSFGIKKGTSIMNEINTNFQNWKTISKQAHLSESTINYINSKLNLL